jgi:hypothetical protein
VTEAISVIEVESDGKRCKLPDVNTLAARSRRDVADARQRPRREQEHHARCRAVDFAAAMKTDGFSCCQAAKQLRIRPRTLAHWCCRRQRGQMTGRCRGRPCRQSPFAKRLVVAEFLREMGPRIGIPTIRRNFPDMPPCELIDLRHDYWSVYRQHNRIVHELLTWHRPGRVWAMDHSKPPNSVDGIYATMFAVRDLASGMELDWIPVPDETAKTTRDALLALFVEFGPPLVLKSDNGGAFKADVIELLADWRVVPLLSPPMTPRYNGSREAGIGGLKTHTHWQAAAFGHPGFWTSEDAEAARQHANETPRAHNQPTPEEIWQARTPIDTAERDGFLLTVERVRSQMEETMDPLSQESLTAADKAANERRVIRQALVELGILSTEWRSISLPIKPRKRARIM